MYSANGKIQSPRLEPTEAKNLITQFAYFIFISLYFFLASFQTWTDELMRLAYNLTQLNGSATMFLQKVHQKLCLQKDKTGKIPVKR